MLMARGRPPRVALSGVRSRDHTEQALFSSSNSISVCAHHEGMKALVVLASLNQEADSLEACEQLYKGMSTLYGRVWEDVMTAEFIDYLRVRMLGVVLVLRVHDGGLEYDTPLAIDLVPRNLYELEVLGCDPSTTDQIRFDSHVAEDFHCNVYTTCGENISTTFLHLQEEQVQLLESRRTPKRKAIEV